MMTYTIPYRRTKTHIWDKVLMGIWVHPAKMAFYFFFLFMEASSCSDLESCLAIVETLGET